MSSDRLIEAEANLKPTLAVDGVADERTRVLKHGDTFALFDHRGDIRPGGLGEQGLYHEGTRYLSAFVLELEGHRPFFLSSTVREENDQFVVALTNPDLLRDGRLWAPLGTLHVTLRRFLWQGACHQRIVLTNHGLDLMSVVLTLHFAADYADIYQVRGMSRKARGSDLPPDVSAARAVLGYHGLDGDARRTVICFDPAPARLGASNARFEVSLAPREERTCTVSIDCEREPDRARPLPHPARSDARESPGVFEIALAEAEADHERYSAWSCHLYTSNAQVNAWVKRATSDLHMLTTKLPTGPYPYAGVPWFNTPFGRDGIITALECLWLRPELARGVLSYLASTQAIETIPEQDAEPGKILHETRNGEMATLREMPFGRYYGSVDATPLFVVLAGAYYERTGDRPFIEELWPRVTSALRWIDEHGDRDQDGFVEYERRSQDGLVHQGWRDTDDAVFHADASLAKAPIALCEVQGYVYAAWRAGAVLANARGAVDDATRWSRRATALRERFEQTFWCEDLGTYALALDGAKRPCRVRTSNAGQCLFTGIASQGRAGELARTLLGADFFSGWGVRTVAASEPRYNPMSYHNGAVWPHDTALIAQGLGRYGFREQALRLWTGLFEAALSFDQYRMPELFCGFPQSPGEGPTLYPVACAPQAWAAASVFLLFQACLGIEVDGIGKTVSFTCPLLPAAFDDLRIHNLAVGDATVDLLLLRHDQDVGVTVLRREGDVRVSVVK
jgi:glycogen debranching enzyme